MKSESVADFAITTTRGAVFIWATTRVARWRKRDDIVKEYSEIQYTPDCRKIPRYTGRTRKAWRTIQVFNIESARCFSVVLLTKYETGNHRSRNKDSTCSSLGRFTTNCGVWQDNNPSEYGTPFISKLALPVRWKIRSVEVCKVWEMQSVQNAGCGKIIIAAFWSTYEFVFISV